MTCVIRLDEIRPEFRVGCAVVVSNGHATVYDLSYPVSEFVHVGVWHQCWKYKASECDLDLENPNSILAVQREISSMWADGVREVETVLSDWEAVSGRPDRISLKALLRIWLAMKKTTRGTP